MTCEATSNMHNKHADCRGCCMWTCIRVHVNCMCCRTASASDYGEVASMDTDLCPASSLHVQERGRRALRVGSELSRARRCARRAHRCGTCRARADPSLPLAHWWRVRANKSRRQPQCAALQQMNRITHHRVPSLSLLCRFLYATALRQRNLVASLAPRVLSAVLSVSHAESTGGGGGAGSGACAASASSPAASMKAAPPPESTAAR